jgi:hypothetical protein
MKRSLKYAADLNFAGEYTQVEAEESADLAQKILEFVTRKIEDKFLLN